MDQDPGGGDQWAVPGWSVPGAIAEEPGLATQPPSAPEAPGVTAPGETMAAGPVGPSRAGAVAPGDVDIPQVDLRPMTVADVVDGAFAIIKARPLRLMGIAAVFVVPVHLLAAYLQRNVLGGVGFGELWFNFDDPAVVAEANQESGGAGELWATVLVLVVPALALMFVAAAVAKLVSDWSAGHDAKAGELLAATGRRWWPVTASYVLVHAAEFAGAFTCYIGTVAAMVLFSLTAPVIGAEGLGPIAAMKRSSRLAGRRFWPVLGINLLIGIVARLLTFALGGLPEFLALWFGLDVAWPLLAAGNIVSAVVATPFVAAATVLLYLDLRARSEGLDIELAARELIDSRVA